MKPMITHAIVVYVIALFDNEPEITALHCSDIIPPQSRLETREAKRDWTQFPVFSAHDESLLTSNGVSWDQPSGWFRRI